MELENAVGSFGGLQKGGREMLKGYKTKLGAAGLILTGLAQLVTVLSGDFSPSDLTEGISLIAAGLAAIGIGAKIDRK